MPMIRARYPATWDAIALAVKQDAKWCCEHCGKPCRQPKESVQQLAERLANSAWHSQLWDGEVLKPKRFVLTVAHLDQDPSNCDRANLQALCAVCHLKYDRRFRAKQQQLKAEWHGQLRIEPPEDAGLQLSLIPTRVAAFYLPHQGEAPTEGDAIQPIATLPQSSSPPEQNARAGKQRQHSPKGQACGWIEERMGNKQRQHPTTSYYYCWDEAIAPGETRRQKVYVKVGQLAIVRRMIAEKRLVAEIVGILK